MDINADGLPDLISGCYAAELYGSDMFGTLQVFHGTRDHEFRSKRSIRSANGKDLLLGALALHSSERFCTKVAQGDLDGDGHPDLVIGNMAGSFVLFRGLPRGDFEDHGARMTLKSGGYMTVSLHSDPFLIDWDQDGDLDLLSGSHEGGVFLFQNTGTKTKPAFIPAKTLIEPPAKEAENIEIGEAHFRGPQFSTRVWAGDLNSDGLLDLLVGDRADVYETVGKLSAAESKRLYAERYLRQQKLAPAPDDTAVQRYDQYLTDIAAIVTRSRTGFVWVAYGHAQASNGKISVGAHDRKLAK